ncbi:hypothetical protein [Aquisediminimonas profunda]|uniref:hypothetical protein n=1 Tax=Aquisediminimonas profunda TaxID=1550733 RepID=UPI001C62D0C2|nr:hypothetical protein [Aquisediminimonas profunda]
MHIISILLSCFAFFIALEAIRLTILSRSGRILEALAGVAPARTDRASVVVPFPVRPRALVDENEGTRLAA